MASKRLKKIGGKYRNKSFNKLLNQLNGRALLVVTIINRHCDECAKLQKFIGQLESGFIEKVPQLVMLYGYSEIPLDAPPEKKSRPQKSDSQNNEEEKEKKPLSDSRLLDWEEIPEGHGYGIFLSDTEIQYYKNDFEHDEFALNIIDNLRRFKSSIKTLAGLNAKRQFIKKQRTGIIIETSGATQQTQIMELEKKVEELGGKLKTPVYFCKSISQEISLIDKGELKYKIRGHNFEKFLKKIPK